MYPGPNEANEIATEVVAKPYLNATRLGGCRTSSGVSVTHDDLQYNRCQRNTPLHPVDLESYIHLSRPVRGCMKENILES